MVFPTLSFVLFYILVWPLSWGALALGRHSLHKVVIIGASYVFYAFWNWKLAFLLFSSVLLNWATGRLIDATRGTGRQFAVVAAGVALNLIVLGFFKYYGWFAAEMNALLQTAGLARDIPLFEIVLPVGDTPHLGWLGHGESGRHRYEDRDVAERIDDGEYQTESRDPDVQWRQSDLHQSSRLSQMFGE